MNDATCARLLELNRTFYATVATPFHATRQGWTPGKVQLLKHLPPLAHPPVTAPPHADVPDAGTPLRVADIGCGNGRLARMLDELDRPVHYVGVDGDATLLALAREQTGDLANVICHFVQRDLSAPDWRHGITAGFAPSLPTFDFVVCLATLQHMPGYALRARVVQDLVGLLAADGTLALSGWQFLTAPRFVDKLIDWAEVGVDPGQVEPGDALLPWRQAVYAVRYVHQIDPQEMARLAADAAAEIVDTFYADGKEGNLNYYALLTQSAQPSR